MAPNLPNLSAIFCIPLQLCNCAFCSTTVVNFIVNVKMEIHLMLHITITVVMISMPRISVI